MGRVAPPLVLLLLDACAVGTLVSLSGSLVLQHAWHIPASPCLFVCRFVLEGEGAAPAEDVEAGAALAAYVQAHPATSAEIKRLCQDLQVLGRGEFKALLKW